MKVKFLLFNRKKILESSQTLLQVLKREGTVLMKKTTKNQTLNIK